MIGLATSDRECEKIIYKVAKGIGNSKYYASIFRYTDLFA